MDTIENVPALADTAISATMGVDLYTKYSDLDDALSVQLSPASHKRYYTDKMADVLVQMGWPKTSPAAEAAIAALYLVDDYINDLADEDTVKQVLADIKSFEEAEKEITSSSDVSNAGNRLMFRRANSLASLVGSFVTANLKASPEAIHDIHAIQSDVPPDIAQGPQPTTPRQLPTQAGSQGRLEHGSAR